MPIEKRKVGERNVRETKRNVRETRDYVPDSQSGSSSQLTGRVVIIGIVLVIFIIFTFSKFNTLSNSDDSQIQALEKKVKSLEGKISTLENKSDWQVYNVTYGGSSDTSNNLSWIGEKSLGFPSYLKGKKCYILGSKISGDDGGTIRGYIGRNNNGSSYEVYSSYEAQINNSQEKIEITKGGTSMLTKRERDNLYFSLTLLCR